MQFIKVLFISGLLSLGSLLPAKVIKAAITADDCGFNCDQTCVEQGSGVTTCVTGAYFCNPVYVNTCLPGFNIRIKCQDGATTPTISDDSQLEFGTPTPTPTPTGIRYDPDDPYAVWNPAGTILDVECQVECKQGAGDYDYAYDPPVWIAALNDDGSPVDSGTCGCISEVMTIYCPAETATLTPTPDPGDPAPTDPATGDAIAPTPGTVLIAGSLQQDVDAALSGAFCTQTTNSPLSLAGLNLYATTYVTSYDSTLSDNSFSKSDIRSSASSEVYHSYFHLAERATPAGIAISRPW